MTNPYRAMCAELVDALDSGISAGRIRMSPLADHARALLAEPDGPAVSDGREPASVATQPSDEDIMGLMPQLMHEDLAAAARALAEQAGTDSRSATGIMRIILNRHAVDFARATLARWGRPVTAPVPESGEVAEVAAWLRLFCSEEYESLGNSHDPDVTWLTRAAELLERRHPAPVPVSERLPSAADCDVEDNCWWFDPHADGAWYVDTFQSCYTHWLPAHALPTPDAKP